MQNTPHLKLVTESFPDGELQIARLSGKEAISRLFEYELLVAGKGLDGFDVEQLMGERAALIYERDGEEVSRRYGMIAMVHDRFDTEVEHQSYRLVFVPRAYRLTMTETLDVFLDRSVPDILREKLAAIGFKERPGREDEGRDGDYDFEFRLHDHYPEREFVVQYKETDLAFISRLCEHIGVSFTFEHVRGRDVIVFTDANEGFRVGATDPVVPFRPRGDQRDVFRLEEAMKMIPADYVVRDYNYRTPQLTLTGQATVKSGVGHVVEYGAHVKTPAEAEQIARIRAEERVASRRVLEGTSDVPLLRAGLVFSLQGHPRGDLGLLVTEVTQTASQVVLGIGAGEGSSFRAEFKAIRSDRRYRPPRLTPKPRIHGVATGVIEASSDGKYADVDDQGRYRVKFLFDTTNPGECQASRPVRMAQPHAGPGYGMHFPLRPGVEVILTFVDGDPDRPIIAATVPNPQTASPVTANNAPRNIIRTGGGNEINIDDTDGSQRIKLSTPKGNTVVQLGAPNAGEEGLAMQTRLSQSSVAGLTVGAITPINNAFNAFSALWSRNVMSLAGTPLTEEFIAAFLGGVGAAADLGTHLTDTIVGYWEVDAKKKEEAAGKAADDLADLRAQQGVAMDNASRNVDALANRATDPTLKTKIQTLKTKIEAYSLAQKKAAEAIDKKAALTLQREAAQAERTELAGQLAAATTEEQRAEIAKSLWAKDEEIRKIDADIAEQQAKIDAVTTAKNEYTAALNDAKSSATATSTPKNTDIDTAVNPITSRDAVPQGATQTPNQQLDAAVTNAATKRAEATKAREDIDSSSPMAAAKEAFSGISTYSGAIVSVLSTLASFHVANVAVRSMQAWVKIANAETDQEMSLSLLEHPFGKFAPADSFVIPTLTPDEKVSSARLQLNGGPAVKIPDFDKWSWRRIVHLCGSDRQGGAYGRELFYVGRKTASLYSFERTIVNSRVATVVHSFKETEVAGGDQVMISSHKKVDIKIGDTQKHKDGALVIEASKSISLGAGVGRSSKSAGDVTITAHHQIKAKAEEGELQLESKGNMFLESTEGELQLKGKGIVSVASTDDELQLSGKENVFLESTAGKLFLKAKKKVSLESLDEDVNISSPKATVSLAGKTAVKIDSDEVKITAKSTTISGTLDVGDALLIKGRMVPPPPPPPPPPKAKTKAKPPSQSQTQAPTK